MAFGDSSLGEAVLDLRADDSILDKDLADARRKTEGWLGGLGNLAGGLVKGGFIAAGAGIVAGIAGLAGIAGTSLAAAIDAEKIEAQTDAVIASTKGIAGVTKDFVNTTAESLSRLTGADDDAIASAENLLLTFTGINKDVFPDTTKAVVDLATAMNNGAIPSAENLQNTAISVGKALNDFDGFNALKRQGVSFSTEQIKLIKKFKETNNLVGYQKLVLAELEKEFGKAGEAAGDTFAGKMARLQTVFGNVQESIGGALLPLVTDLLDAFLEFVDSNDVQQWFESVVNFIKGDVVPNVKSFLELVRMLATGDFRGGIFGLQEDDPWIVTLLDARDMVVSIFGWLQKLAGAIGQGDWGAVFSLLVTGIQSAWGFIQPILADWGTKFWDWLTGENGVIKQVGTKLGEFVGGIGEWLAIHGPDKWEQLKIWASDFWDWLTGENGALDQVNVEMGKWTQKLVDWAKSDAAQTGAREAGKALADALFSDMTGDGKVELGDIVKVIDKFLLPIDTAIRDIGKAGDELAAALWEGFWNASRPKISEWVDANITPLRDQLLKLLAPFNNNTPLLPGVGGNGIGGVGGLPNTFNLIPQMRASGAVGQQLHVYIDGQEIKNAVVGTAYDDIKSLFGAATSAVGGTP